MLLIGIPWLWIFWPILTGEMVVGFRDSAYLYYPLFQWIDAQWAVGEIPLWNPFCNFGMPVVADGTSSVFYPGKLVFFLRFLSYPARYGIYLAMHIPLAAIGSYWFARTLKANRAGATLAAFSFAFGGSVLFQVTNVVYLVSAAWLPFGLCCVWKFFRTGQFRWATGGGVCCALMILGGDPQMVYHVGLITIATAIGEFIQRKRGYASGSSKTWKRDSVWMLRVGALITVMIFVTSGLAAIQLLPTLYWSQLSERTNPEVPANVYQAWDSVQRDGNIQAVSDALLGDPIGSAEHAYQFSQPPWSLPELVWPNFSGSPFPTHQRWASSLAGADRIWVPSLYVGLVTVLLGVLGIRFWGRRRRQVWLTYICLFFMLASFGWYGIGWLCMEIYPPLGLETSVGPQVGGVYWLMTMILPKYFAFRYPAKLFLIASLAISVLAGLNFRISGIRYAVGWCLFFLGLTGCGLAAVNAFAETWMKNIFPDAVFGPFDLVGAKASLQATLVHSLAVGSLVGILLLVIHLSSRRLQPNRRKLIWGLSCAIVVTAAVDVAISNRWLVPVIDASIFESENPVRDDLIQLKAEINGPAPLRVYRSTFDYFEPRDWQNQRSLDRLSEVVRWQRETLYPKHHLGENVVLLGSFSSISPASTQEYLESMEWYRNGAVLPNGQQSSVLKWFHVSLEYNTDEQPVFREFEPVTHFGSALPIDWMFEFDPATETQGTTNPQCLWISEQGQSRKRTDQPDCQIVEFENSRFVARVSTPRPRVLTFFAPVDHGWSVRVRDLGTNQTQPAKLIELKDWVLAGTSRFSNTLLLQFPDPGEFEVEFTYSPKEFWVGAWISGFCWVAILFGFTVCMIRRRVLPESRQ